MLEKIQALPGVTKAAVTTGTPGRGTQFGTRFNIVGQPVNPSVRMGTAIQMVTPEYVDTLGIRMVSGRNINEYDTATSVRVATVNEHFVKQYFVWSRSAHAANFVSGICSRLSREESRSSGRSWACITMFAARDFVRTIRRSMFRLRRVHGHRLRW